MAVVLAVAVVSMFVKFLATTKAHLNCQNRELSSVEG